MIGHVPPAGNRAPTARRDMRLSTGEGWLFCVMVGVGETYFVAFALALGLGEVVSGLVASVPMLIGAVLQLATPMIVRRLGSLRKAMTLYSAVQAASFLPLLLGIATGRMPAWALFAAVGLYWTVNLGQGPVWSTWITSLIPRRVRASYFATRSRILQTGVLLGLIAGGLTLDRTAGGDGSVRAFAWLFALAFVCRAVGSRMLAMHSEPEPLPRTYRLVGMRELLGRWRTGADVNLLVFLLAAQLAQQIAAPFFTPFVLERRGFEYWQFMVVVAAVIAGKFAMLGTIGRLARRIGPRRVLWIGAIGTVPTALLWLAADSFPKLVVAQLAAGTVWATYEMGALLLQWEAIREHERTSMLATFNLLNGCVVVTGSLIGATLLGVIGPHSGGYAAIFTAAAGLRLLVVPLLLRVKPAEFEVAPLPVRTVHVDPGVGTDDRPVLGAIANEPAAVGDREE
jgi:MFS family permease